MSDVLEVLASGPLGQLATFLVEEEPWRSDSACRDVDVSVFFPERGASTKEAHSLCRTCPVAAQCEDYANRTGTQYGIWGGALRNPGKLKIEREAAAEVVKNLPTPVSSIDEFLTDEEQADLYADLSRMVEERQAAAS